MGWLSDFVSNPVSTVVDTASNVVNTAVSNPLETAALGAGAYFGIPAITEALAGGATAGGIDLGGGLMMDASGNITSAATGAGLGSLLGGAAGSSGLGSLLGGALSGVSGSALSGVLSGLTTAALSKGQQGYAYNPQNLNSADAAWLQSLQNQQATAQQTGQAVSPLYQQSLQQQQAVNYAPYLQGAQQAGQSYAGLANLAGQQAGQYGQQAGVAQQQQQNLYGLGNQIAQTAFDPQQALYGRTQQQLAEQVNAGQAARGLGVSPVGGQEYNQAMSNFNIDWQNAQLQRQLQGIQGAGAASAAGAGQAQLAGADLAAQLATQGQVPTFQQQAGQVPTAAQQYVAGQPAAAAQAYQTGMSGLQGQYQNVGGAALPYLTGGVGAQQAQQQFNAGQQQNLASGLTQAFNAAAPSVASWLGSSSGSGGAGTSSAFTPSVMSSVDQWWL
jgi:hypothetical protein